MEDVLVLNWIKKNIDINELHTCILGIHKIYHKANCLGTELKWQFLVFSELNYGNQIENCSDNRTLKPLVWGQLTNRWALYVSCERSTNQWKGKNITCDNRRKPFFILQAKALCYFSTFFNPDLLSRCPLTMKTEKEKKIQSFRSFKGKWIS